MDEPLYSEDPDVIRGWAAECLEAKLYRDDGVCRYVFAGEAEIRSMAYLPGIGWSMYHGWPARFNLDWVTWRPDLGVYVRPDMRRRGIGKMLSTLACDENRARNT